MGDFVASTSFVEPLLVPILTEAVVTTASLVAFPPGGALRMNAGLMIEDFDSSAKSRFKLSILSARTFTVYKTDTDI